MSLWNTAAVRFACMLLLCFASQVRPALAETGADDAIARSNSNKPGAVHPLRLVVGFMGGRVKPNNFLHKEAVIAQDLLQGKAQDLSVLVFANHNGGAALSTILNLLDQNGDHILSEAERSAAHIAIYGHSWGASETIALARSLQTRGIPVALTVQVDSVQKHGQNDEAIPSNVREAVNLYQRDGLLRGRASIHAEDATRTSIILNQQYHYDPRHTVDIARFPWFARTFMREHIMIENDPEVWARVESLLRQAIETQNGTTPDTTHVALATNRPQL